MQMINFRMQIKIFQNKRKRTIQMEFIQYKLKSNKINRKLIDYKKKNIHYKKKRSNIATFNMPKISHVDG